MPLDAGGFPLAGTPLQIAVDGSFTIDGSIVGASGSGQAATTKLISLNRNGKLTIHQAPSTANGETLGMLQLFDNVDGNNNPALLVTNLSGVASSNTSLMTAGNGGVGNNASLYSNSIGTLGLSVGANAKASLNTQIVAGQIGFCNNNTTVDAWVGRNAAATVQQGAASAASPVAQTLQAQGSRSGTDSDIGGASYTIRSGTGTGTGTLSSLILQSPVAVASGTGAQTQTTGLTIKGGQYVDTVYTVATLPTGIQGGHATVTDSNAASYTAGIGAIVAAGGATVVPVFYDGTNWRIG